MTDISPIEESVAEPWIEVVRRKVGGDVYKRQLETNLALWDLPLPLLALDAEGRVCRWSEQAGTLFLPGGVLGTGVGLGAGAGDESAAASCDAAAGKGGGAISETGATGAGSTFGVGSAAATGGCAGAGAESVGVLPEAWGTSGLWEAKASEPSINWRKMEKEGVWAII